MVEQNKKVFWIRAIVGIVMFISWFSLFTLDEGKSKTPILIVSIIITGIFIFSIIGKRLTSKLKSEPDSGKIPEAISQDKILEIVDDELKRNFWNYRMEGTLMPKITFNIGNNIIQCLKIKLFYEERFDKEWTDEVFIIINATYPNKVQPSILPPSADYNGSLKTAINYASLNPSADPDIEITRTTLDQFNRPVEVREKRLHKDFGKEPEKKESAVI